jgi:hypothetical protein
MRRITLLVSVLLGFVAAQPAQASYDPIGTGVTRLVLDKRFSGFLDRAGVRVATTAGATKRGRALIFPVSGGNADPTSGRGEIDQLGSLSLRGPRGRVQIRKLLVKTTHAPLVGKVGGSQLKIATSASIASSRKGFGAGFSAKKLLLTEKVATRLNKKLRPRQPFRAGQLLGALVCEAQPALTAIVPAGRATLVFDSTFVAKLERHFVSLNPIFPAEHQGATFTLPIIANGLLAPDASRGTLRTGGDVEFLQLGAGQIFWHELWFDLSLRATLAEVDLEPAPTFPGKIGQVAVFDLGGGMTSSDPAARTIGVSGLSLTLEADAAAAFNRAFTGGAPDFAAGELIGSLSFTAQGQ